MRYRKLRIAWSVFWGLACVLLIVLWVRSYFRVEFLLWQPTKTSFDVQSNSGKLYAGACEDPDLGLMTRAWKFGSVPWREDFRPKPTNARWDFESNPQSKHFDCQLFGFKCIFNSTPLGQHFDFSLTAPYWFLVIAAAAAIGIPWIRWSKRFSLRTLLLATTLVAVVLGLIVYAVR
jgi:hypothetical protein